MSVRFLNNDSSNNTDVVAKSFPATLPLPTPPWVRNPSWSSCEANPGDNRVQGLYAVHPSGANFIAMTVSGAYTIDFGDGTTTDFTSGEQANYEYDYSAAALVGTEAPVTFTDVGDLVTRTGHGYTNGTKVQFFNITTTTGIADAQFYFVINATADTFQVAATEGGAALPLTNNGTGQLLPYRIATVTVTPQSGSDLTSVNLFVKHSQAGLQGYTTGWLDIAIASPTITTLIIGNFETTIRQNYIERVRLNQLGAITSFSSLFQGLAGLQNVEISNTITTVTSTLGAFTSCINLQTVPLFNTASVTDMGSMFSGCSNLQTIPLFNTASVTDMEGMFFNCFNLQTVPLFNTASVTNMFQMFQSCISLFTVPLFNTASVTSMRSMFNGCTSLQTVPLFNTALVTNMGNMFTSCFVLQTVPLFNTASVTNMGFMLSNCFNLQTVPLFNTASVVDMSSMFNGCRSLKTVPLFNTALVTNMSNMFTGCTALQTIPLFNTVSVININTMFQSCSSLSAIPALITTSVPTAFQFSALFVACPSLARIEARDFRFTFSVANCKLSATALDEIYTNLPTVTGQTITVTGNYGTAADNPAIATAKGWTVTG